MQQKQTFGREVALVGLQLTDGLTYVSPLHACSLAMVAERPAAGVGPEAAVAISASSARCVV